MTFQPNHMGLYFDTTQLQRARADRAAAPFSAAWERLTQATSDDLLTAAVWGAYRWRFMDDANAGATAITQFQQAALPENALGQLQYAVTLAHLIEQLRSHPAFPRDFLAEYARFVDSLLQTPTPDLDYVAKLWQHALRIVAGVVVENATWFEAGVTAFKQVIDEDIHPEGFIKQAVQGKDGMTFQRQMHAVIALTLAAEAATHAGVNLWEYDNRGISLSTAAAYLLYYYFYPDKWRWEDNGTLTTDFTKAYFQEWGAFMEIVTYRANPRNIDILLDEQRPMFSVSGGLTTLTHVKPAPPKKRGWFG